MTIHAKNIGLGDMDAAVEDLAHAMGTGDILLDANGIAPSDIMTDEQLLHLARGILNYLDTQGELKGRLST